MTPDERCERVARAIEATVSGDTSLVCELFTPDVVAWSPTVSVTSRVELAVELEDEDDGFSDIEVETGPFVSTADRVCAEWVASATHADLTSVETGSLVAPPERRVTVRGVTVAEFDGEKICAMRHYWNERELLTGLGWLPGH
jgi:ketosteroid isomerase-like protein